MYTDVVSWIPPPQGTMKLNFDGGLSRQRGSAVAGGIFRDHRGFALFSYASSDVGLTPYDGEAKALALGLNYARSFGFSRLWVEGDAQFLIDAVDGRRENKWYDGHTLENIRRLMEGFPWRPALTWVPREANSAADALVKHVRNDSSPVVHTRWHLGAGLPVTVAEVVDRERHGCSYTRRGCYQQQQQLVRLVVPVSRPFFII